MASPTYDSVAIFDSKRSDNSTFTEGNLFVEDYTPIIQKLHFNQEDGDRYLVHGFGDREWVYEGLLSSPTLADLQSKIAIILGKINDFQSNPTTYKTLVDSYGTTYTSAAQIHHFHFLERPHIEINGGYVCRIRVSGVLQGSLSSATASSSSSG